MKLIQIKIDGYKHLKNTCVDFNNRPDGELFYDGIPIRFFIGLNGSGKSVFLEAICLLFSRIVQDEVPGFDFILIYEIYRNGNYRVEVTNKGAEGSLLIRVKQEGEEGELVLSSFENHREFLPDYVMTCASGANNNFYDIMVSSPKDSLQSDLFDLSLLGRSMADAGERKRRIGEILRSLKSLEENPICMFIDEKNAVLALAAFLSVLPGGAGTDEAGIQMRCRKEILSRVSDEPSPVSLSLVLDAKRAEELADELPQYGPVFEMAHWDTLRLYQDETVDEKDGHSDRALTYLFEPCLKEDGVRYVKSLTEGYQDPIEFLSKLILARGRGILKECHLTFRLRGTEDILEENALSEGEYMYLVRMGLLAMGRQSHSSQCLFLYDEPDVYLNERWNIDFVSDIQKIFEGSRAMHEIVVATHSTLMLTDAFPEQLYYFRQKNGAVSCQSIRASTFGGSRNEIMEALFGTEHSVGSYSYGRVKKLLEEEEDVEKLEACLKMVGSGYLRLRLLDKIHLLKDR